MKSLLILAFGLFAVTSLRADEDFAAKKAEMVKHIDERIAKMQEHKACVEAASEKDALKACMEKMKEHMKEHRMEMMEHRKEMMEKRKERMEKKK